METPSPEKQVMISLFQEIAAGQSIDTAVQFLQATSWKLEEALQLFYLGNEANLAASSSLPIIEDRNPSVAAAELPMNNSVNQNLADKEDVRAPLPTKRDTLYGDAPALFRLHANALVTIRNFNEESKNHAVWESDQNAASTTIGSCDNLASLYRPPFALMFQGPFDKAKVEATLQDKWLLINLQSTEEFSSHMLNRDTWSNDALAQTIRSNFIFWQVYHDTSEGKKVSTYYNLVTIPSVLIIDPITGQKMRAWLGMVHPERLLEDLLPFLDNGPKEHHVTLPRKRHRQTTQHVSTDIPAVADSTVLDGSPEDEDILKAVAASLEDARESTKQQDNGDEAKSDVCAEGSTEWKPAYPPLPDEPTASRELLCRVCIRLPDGRRLQRTFLMTDSIKLLWSFCCTRVEGGETRPFSFTLAIPGAAKLTLGYESNSTFEEAGLSGSMLTLAWG